MNLQTIIVTTMSLSFYLEQFRYKLKSLWNQTILIAIRRSRTVKKKLRFNLKVLQMCLLHQLSKTMQFLWYCTLIKKNVSFTRKRFAFSALSFSLALNVSSSSSLLSAQVFLINEILCSFSFAHSNNKTKHRDNSYSEIHYG